MRNLKKVLALVLALAMALSVMASAFTAPALSEEAQAEYDAMTAAQQNAFYLVEALGIVNGYPDGSFKPDATLTRAEFAKMIYVAKTGANDASNLFASSSIAMFSDAADITANASWAIPYIAYAYSTGIIAGYNDGSFKANGNVTGLEAAKMLLTALGYEAEIEGLVGPTFKASTIALASRVGLLKGVVGDLEAPATRADAFVMVANAIAANTVTYVGGVAAPKTETINSQNTITLGEEGFDLLDVEAVLVANSDVALGAYWRNILKNNTVTSWYGELIDYRLYQTAPAGYARFVYRDYAAADAANEGAYYYDRVITVALGDQAAKFAELGEMYRILVTDIADVYNNNEYRVLYGYPVEQANDAYYKVTEGQINGLKASVINAMQARYAAVNGEDNEEAIDNTIFVNGAAKSFKDAKVYCENKSTAPYKAVDNDNDGVVDALFIYDYTIGKVIAVDGENVTVQGAGLGKIDFANDVELAAGDYVAVWSDKDSKFAKKLDVYEGNVTGYNGADKAWTINGEAKVEGKYMSTASKSLMGAADSALTETVYKYVFDGKYIVNVEVTENTRYAKYALVETLGDNYHTYLHYQCITLYTEDNERVTGYLKGVNGSLDAAELNKLTDNALVSYTVDGDFIYLTTLDNGFDGNTDSTDYEFIYNRATDTWEGLTTNGIVSFKDTYGVVFVSYKNGTDNTDGTVSYRAYLDGEFMPNYYNPSEANERTGKADTVIYASQNGVCYIKAAKIDFNHPTFELPGLPATRANDNIVIVKSADVVNVTAEGYVYKVTTFDPWATSSTTYETIAFAQAKAMPKVGQVYNFKTNADGKLVDWTAQGVDVANVATAYDRVGAFELEAYVANGINLNPSNAIITLTDVRKIDNRYEDMMYVDFPINYNADADVWFLEIAADGTITAKDWVSYVAYDYNNANTDKEYAVFVDLDEMTQTAQRIIVVAGAKAGTINDQKVTLNARSVDYDVAKKTVTYTFWEDDVTRNENIFASLVLDPDGKLVVENVMPWDAPYSNGKVEVTFVNDGFTWKVESIKGVSKVDAYNDANGTQSVVFGDNNADNALIIKTATDSVVLTAAQAANVKVYMNRTVNGRLDLLNVDSWASMVGKIKGQPVAYNAGGDDNTIFNYEEVKVIYGVATNAKGYVTDESNIIAIVLVDTSATTEEANVFPYNVNATTGTTAPGTEKNTQGEYSILA